MMTIIRSVLLAILNIYELILLARVLISWIDPTMQQPVSRILVQLTEPVLAPLRRIIPPAGSFDLSPLVAFIIIAVLVRLVMMIN
jgi:YggT family protein